jgi:hypothetical protein
MRWWPFGRGTPDDRAASGDGARLLVATFGRLLWYFPETDSHRVVQDGRGKYYGMSPWSADWEEDGRLLVVSRPDQEKDDRLLLVDHRTGRTIRKLPLGSRDTHHAARSGDRYFVTDTFRGRVLEYALPGMELVRAHDGFSHEHHVNTVLVEPERLFVLCHNKGDSWLAVLDRASGETVDRYDDVGQHSHDLSAWRDQIVICDSRGGALILVDRATKACRTAYREEGAFTKGLAVEGDVAWFAISKAATRAERIAVSCDLVAYDLAADEVLWRRPIPSNGLVNSIVTATDLFAQMHDRGASRVR